MRLGPVLTCVGLSSVLAACVTAGHSDFSYSPPKATAVKNEIQLDEPFDAVWDRLVGRLATGFFVINNIDKSSRIINVSFSTDSPVQYVDCGRSTRAFTFNGEHKIYDYAVAESYAFKAAAGTWGPLRNLPVIASVSRSTSLDGRINIYVAPTSPRATKVTVNAKYILHVARRGMAYEYNALGGLMNQTQLPLDTWEISFTTSERGTKSAGATSDDLAVTCETSGTLERDLIGKASS